ncbi:hypothetical protein MSAN_02069400 [Mycena sanguinolenta]|uniref:BTB domain-containing protein n=1 Tax=Mycena sanguinolenta TaxID=230812 RepID=A0A8H7CL68_9AGAR|nr:hypothetical protein MSAN_02069400 [Mycena sanguinolenta]
MDRREHIPIENPQEGIIRVQDLWFPGTDLVIQAGNRLFRISGGILAARSTVFQDMLSIPQPDTQPSIDGCLVVVLHDAPADVEYFLKAVFDSGFFERPPAPAKFDVVAGVLRLSTKYDVEYLRMRALLHLSAALPRSLAEYNSIRPVTDPRPFHPEKNPQFPLLILVHELGLTWALPMALYFASAFAVQHIMDGVAFNGHNIQLPQPVQRTLLIGRTALAFAQIHNMLQCLRDLPCQECVVRGHCQSGAKAFHELMAGSRSIYPLTLMHPGIWDAFNPLLCTSCFATAQADYQTARQKLWDELPAMFELGSWAEVGPAPV